MSFFVRAKKRIPFIPQIKIFNPTLNTRVTLEMKDFVKYLGIMIDSELSWKHHIDFICHKISRSVGIIAKMRHYIPRHLLLIYIMYLFLLIWIMVYVHGATFHRPTSVTYLFCKNVHCIWFIFLDPEAIQSLFFIESNCLPLPSLFFQQSSYLMHEVHAKTAPKSLLDKFAKINTKHHNTRISAKEFKFSTTETNEKMFY